MSCFIIHVSFYITCLIFYLNCMTKVALQDIQYLGKALLRRFQLRNSLKSLWHWTSHDPITERFTWQEYVTKY